MIRPSLLILQLFFVLLFCGIAVAWIWSYRSTHGWIYRVIDVHEGATHEHEAALWWGKGRFVFSRHHAISYRGPSPVPERTRQWLIAPVSDPAIIVPNYATTKSVLGIRRIDVTSSSGGDWLIVPAWWLLLLFLTSPLYSLLSRIRGVTSQTGR